MASKKQTEKAKKVKIDLKAKPKFETVKPFLRRPLEITRDLLPGINMVDENIIIYDNSNLIKQDAE